MFGEQIVGAKTSRAGHVGSGGFSPQALSPVSSPLIPHLASTFLRSLRSRPVTALPRYYGRCDSCPSRRVTSCSTAVHPVSGQASLLTVLDLPAIPSPTTCVRSVSPRHVTCRRIESRLLPHGSSPNGNSRLRPSLAGSPRNTGRIEFLIVRTGRSPPVTLHPVSRRRSYLRLRVIVYPKRTFTSPAKHLRSRDRAEQRSASDQRRWSLACDVARASEAMKESKEGRNVSRKGAMTPSPQRKQGGYGRTSLRLRAFA
jgi:hypothetical protein